MKSAVITCSDSGFMGKREDKSGPEVKKIAEEYGYETVFYKILPDDRKMISDELIKIADGKIADVIFTTGGTGFSKRDITPEATIDVCEKLVPGIPEAMRFYSMQITKRAMLSRAACGIRKDTLIINLPGSVKAVKECMEVIMPELKHGIEILNGSANNCGGDIK